MGAPRIAVDAFGGDHCPGPELEAALTCARDGIEVRLVGDEAELRRGLADESIPSTLQIVHAPDRIGMDESPGRAVRRKPNASMPVAFDLCVRGEAEAVVSAGNSGAMLACGVFKLRRLRSVDRPAVAATFPREQGHTCVLDSGANVDCRPLHLAQFAVMGSTYARVHLGVDRPRVAVLSNGAEDAKGTALTRAAHHALASTPSPDFEYIGYVEGNRLFTGYADVIVTDGFTGNIALKTAEGTVLAVGRMLARALNTADHPQAIRLGPALAEVRRRLDPDEYGGAPLLGVDGIAIICHGASSPRALESGIRVARRFAEASITDGVREAIERHRALFDVVRSGDYSSSR
jgi:glycerol-3-phosphate acyltransferase PlsX